MNGLLLFTIKRNGTFSFGLDKNADFFETKPSRVWRHPHDYGFGECKITVKCGARVEVLPLHSGWTTSSDHVTAPRCCRTTHCRSDQALSAGASACPSPRSYQAPRVGISPNKVALHVGIHFYVDKELMVRR